MLTTYRKNMVNALERNSVALFSFVPVEDLPVFDEGEAVRFSAHGELINMNHLMNLYRIVCINPLTVFTLWTKRKDFIKKFFDIHDKPANLILIYSNPEIDKVMDEPPKYFDKTFNNVSEETEGENCTGQKCKDCMKCYTMGDKTSTIIERVK